MSHPSVSGPMAGLRSRFLQGTRVDVFTLSAALAAALYMGVLGYSFGGMIIRLFTGAGAWEAASTALGSRGLDAALKNTGWLLVTAVPLALTISACFAWLNERTDASMGWASRVLPLLPFFIPNVALSIGWIFLGSENAGFINSWMSSLSTMIGGSPIKPLNISSWPGLIFVYVLHLVPYGYLVISAALRNVDSSQDEASRMCGAGVIRTGMKVSLPAILPGLASAALLMVVSTMALFSIPSIVGAAARIDVLSVHIVRLINGSFPPRIDEAIVLSVFVFAVVGSVWALQRRVARKGQHSTIGGKGGRRTVVRLGQWKWFARAAMIVYLAATSLLPAFALAVVALQPFWSPSIDWSGLSLDNLDALMAGSSLTREALFTSGWLATAGATVGVAIAAILMVYARQRGRMIHRLIDGGTKVPAAVSNVVLGVAFVVSLGGPPFMLQGTILILLLAYVVVYMPQASIAAGSANEQIGSELLEASRMSGGSIGRTFRRVTLPLMTPGLAAGWAFLFVLMIGDLTVSALLAGNQNPVVGFVILSIWENGTFSTLAAMALMVTVVSTTVVGVVLSLAHYRTKSAMGG